MELWVGVDGRCVSWNGETCKDFQQLPCRRTMPELLEVGGLRRTCLYVKSRRNRSICDMAMASIAWSREEEWTAGEPRLGVSCIIPLAL